METVRQHIESGHQVELLRRYCTEADTLIQNAANAAEARSLAERLCRRFRDECESPLVVNATRDYIEGTITKLFGGNR